MTTVAPSTDSVEMSLVERIAKIEDSLKDLKRAARQELKARRRRRAAKTGVNGEKVAKGETPQQLKAWHDEVRSVWDEMRTKDAKTPYKRAVAEASARRKNTDASTTVTATTAPVVAKSVKKTAVAAAATPVVAVEAPKPAAKKVVKAGKA